MSILKNYWPVILVAMAIAFVTPALFTGPERSSVVKVTVGGGHGSGVHIGDGYVLTANHVLTGKDAPVAKVATGEEQKLSILWRSVDYDIALMKLEGDLPVGTASLDCREKPIGTEIEASGNPLNQEFISAWGHISGSTRAALPKWKVVAPVNALIVQGMSGGPAFGKDGRIIGINVGTLIMNIGMGGSMTGQGFIVPSSVICDLLAR